MTINVASWLDRWARYTPEKTAIVEDATSRRFSYRDFNGRVTLLAAALQRRYSLQPGERVAVLAFNRLEILELFFAVARLGAILVPLNYRLAGPELAGILRDAAPRLLFFGSDCAPLLDAIGTDHPVDHPVTFDADPIRCTYDEILAGDSPEGPRPCEVPPDHPLAILYTSGTTGLPKGAVLTHGTVTWNAIITQLGWDLHRDDITLTHTPFFHTGGLNVLTTPLLQRGGTVVLMKAFDAARSLELIEQERCTVVFAVPTMFQMMLESPAFATADLSSLRFFITGGAPCPVPLIEAYARRGVVFKQGYGLTEAGPNCFTLDARDAVRKAGSVGFPNFYVEVRVVDSQGREVPAGAVGELLIRGPHVFSGYWRNPEATAQALKDGWLHTGDLVRRDEEGYTTIVDRQKDMFISGGENVYPAELEKLLHRHPAIREAAVIGVPHPRWGEVGRAIVVLQPGYNPAEADVIGFLKGQVARYKLPKSVVFTSELPRNPGGKLLKQVLRPQFASADAVLAC